MADINQLVNRAEEFMVKAPYLPLGLAKEMIAALKEHDAPTVSGWISVEDRLPETRHAVLVYTPHYKNIWAASMHEDRNWYIWSPHGRAYLDPDWHGPITHWMPLPEPPQEGDT